MYPDHDHVENQEFWLALRLRISDAQAQCIYRAVEGRAFSEAFGEKLNSWTPAELKEIFETY